VARCLRCSIEWGCGHDGGGQAQIRSEIVVRRVRRLLGRVVVVGEGCSSTDAERESGRTHSLYYLVVLWLWGRGALAQMHGEREKDQKRVKLRTTESGC
jgi:hypothetical protein